jgi:hypothetical protein
MTMNGESGEDVMGHDEKECRHTQGHEVCGKCAAEYVLELTEIWKVCRRLGMSEKTLFVRDFIARILDVTRELEMVKEARSARRTVDDLLDGITERGVEES